MRMSRFSAALTGLAVSGFSTAALAAGSVDGAVQKQATNWTAIIMFVAFVLATLGITYWAARRTKSAKDFYAAGGGITGFQNGLAIAGDYMSAASFLGIAGLVFSAGFDGLIYSIGFLVGWPIILFLIAERLRNLGKFTFADVASFRFRQTPIRSMAASGTLVVVILYLIAQMVGAGKLIQLLFGLDYTLAVVLVGVLMGRLCDVRRYAGHHLGADHQSCPAAVRCLVHGLHGDGEVRLLDGSPVRQGHRSVAERYQADGPGWSGV